MIIFLPFRFLGSIVVLLSRVLCFLSSSGKRNRRRSGGHFLNKLLITVLNKQTDKRTKIKTKHCILPGPAGFLFFRTEERRWRRRKRRAFFSEQIIGSNILFVLLCIYISFFLFFFFINLSSIHLHPSLLYLQMYQ